MTHATPILSLEAVASGGPSKPWDRRDWVAVLVLAVAVLALYSRACTFDFVDYDDNEYVYANPHLVGGFTIANLRFAMGENVINWHPLTMLCVLGIASVFGPTAGVFHVTNVILHAANVAMLFIFLRGAKRQFWPAAFAAALWGLHPLRVESVAWVSELKDVLCGFMWLACMLAYLRYTRLRSVGRYLPVVATAALALMAKPMAVTLPAALLLLDVWPLGNAPSTAPSWPRRWWLYRILEKVPLAVLSTGAVAAALITQKKAMRPGTLFSVPVRLENAVVSIVDYLRDTAYPAHLSVFYPHPAMTGISVSTTVIACSVTLLATITTGACVLFRSTPFLFVGWFWFLGTLVPVLGLVQVGEQSRADRYTYVPSIGLAFAVVWTIAMILTGRKRWQKPAAIIGAGAVVLFAISTERNLSYWRNTDTLFTHADSAVPDNYIAKSILGYHCELAGDKTEGLRLATEAARIAPMSSTSMTGYGIALFEAGRLDDAVAAFSRVLTRSRACYSLGRVYETQADQRAARDDRAGEIGLREKAADAYQKALEIDPNDARSADALASVNLRLNHSAAAIKIWNDLLHETPGFGPAHAHLGEALLTTGDTTGAIAELRQAVVCGDRDPKLETNLARLVASDPRQSIETVLPMIPLADDARDQTRGQDPVVLDTLAICLARVGRFDDAVIIAQAALDRARQMDNPNLVTQIQLRLTKYRTGQPYLTGGN